MDVDVVEGVARLKVGDAWVEVDDPKELSRKLAAAATLRRRPECHSVVNAAIRDVYGTGPVEVSVSHLLANWPSAHGPAPSHRVLGSYLRLVAGPPFRPGHGHADRQRVYRLVAT